MANAQAHWQDLPPSELDQRVAEAIKLLARARSLLPGLQRLSDEERAHLAPLREGEDSALLSTLRAAELRPGAFQSLADRDGGRDPETFETGYLRELLRKRAALAELHRALTPFAQAASDAVLGLGAEVKEPALAAYRIASSLREGDPAVREALRPASEFYAAIAARSRARGD
jgi:hypothetical protein